MNRREAFKIGKKCFNQLKPTVAGMFGSMGGVVLAAMETECLVLYNKTDLQRMRNMIDIALSHQLEKKRKKNNGR